MCVLSYMYEARVYVYMYMCVLSYTSLVAVVMHYCTINCQLYVH